MRTSLTRKVFPADLDIFRPLRLTSPVWTQYLTSGLMPVSDSPCASSASWCG